MAWNSEPELYTKTSVMSPVDSRVLTMLSPSPPCGRVSTLTVMSGFFAVKSLASCSAVLTVSSLLSTRNDERDGAALVVVAGAEAPGAARGERERARRDDRERTEAPRRDVEHDATSGGNESFQLK